MNNWSVAYSMLDLDSLQGRKKGRKEGRKGFCNL
jgi:hypothetical protein